MSIQVIISKNNSNRFPIRASWKYNKNDYERVFRNENRMKKFFRDCEDFSKENIFFVHK